MFGEGRYNEENILTTCIIITVKRNKKPRYGRKNNLCVHHWKG